MFEPALFPSFEEGWLRPTNKISRYLSRAQPGRSDKNIEAVLEAIPEAIRNREWRLTSPAAPIS